MQNEASRINKARHGRFVTVRLSSVDILDCGCILPISLSVGAFLPPTLVGRREAYTI